jgi:hypothetical protein
MKLQRYWILSFGIALSAALTGCFGGGEDHAVEEAVVTDETAAANDGEVSEELTTQEDTSQEEGTSDASMDDAAMASTTETPQLVIPVPAPVPPASTATSSHVVVFVTQSACVARSAKDIHSTTVAKYSQGDAIVGSWDGSWFFVNEDRYLEGPCVSTKLVPRPKAENPWVLSSKSGL